MRSLGLMPDRIFRTCNSLHLLKRMLTIPSKLDRIWRLAVPPLTVPRRKGINSLSFASTRRAGESRSISSSKRSP